MGKALKNVPKPDEEKLAILYGNLPKDKPFKDRKGKSKSKPSNSPTSEVAKSASSEVAELHTPEVKDQETSELQNQGTSEVTKSVTSELHSLETSEHPKYRTFEVKLSVLFREDQVDFLNRLQRTIIKGRSKENKKERITKNSIIRAIVDSLKSLEIDTREIADETELLKRINAKLTREI